MRIQTTLYRPESGWSLAPDPTLDSPSTLVLGFGAAGLGAEAAPFDALRQTFPNAVLLGCSTAGEIAGVEVHDDCLSVAAIHFEHTQLRHASAEVASAAHSAEAGSHLARQLAPPTDDGEVLRAVFVLSDGLGVNGSSLVQALVGALPDGVSVSGGLAGDGDRFGQTWVLDQGARQAGRVCAVGLYGSRLQLGNGCDDGWHDFGPLRRITRSEGNVLYELDGQPALDLYTTYLGKLASGLPGAALLFPLAVHRPGSDDRPVVRTILGIDSAAKTMTFAGDIPQGHEARLMRSTDEHLIASAEAAMTQALAPLSGCDDALVITVSCVGRRLMLGERTDEELEGVQRASAGRVHHLGFYSYGEIAPGFDGGCSELHNQTITVTSFAER